VHCTRPPKARAAPCGQPEHIAPCTYNTDHCQHRQNLQGFWLTASCAAFKRARKKPLSRGQRRQPCCALSEVWTVRQRPAGARLLRGVPLLWAAGQRRAARPGARRAAALRPGVGRTGGRARRRAAHGPVLLQVALPDLASRCTALSDKAPRSSVFKMPLLCSLARRRRARGA
jgi:hypothetical protein